MTVKKAISRSPAGKKDGKKLAAGPSCCINLTANGDEYGLHK